MTLHNYQGTKGEVVIDTYTTTLPWSMFTVTWNTNVGISSKEDSSKVTTTYGQKNISVTNTFHDVYGGYPELERGIMLKINAETEKSLMFWAHGCEVAQITSPCGSISDAPYFKVTYRKNTHPSVCKLKNPVEDATNSASVSLEPYSSIDPDSGPPVRYTGRICTDIACNQLIWQGNLYVGSKTQIMLDDGNYFLSCQADDRHQGAPWGEQKQLVIDTTPPEIPSILDEPPYTSSSENSIFWLLNLHEEVTYQVLASERSNFTAYNTYSPWITGNTTSFTHTKDKTIYYKMRARDKAGNESGWSSPTSTVIDTTYPAVKYFKTNKTLLSPKLRKDLPLEGTAYLQGGSEEANIDKLRLEIRNFAHNVVYNEEITDKSYLWTHWPEKEGYEDGTYFAVFFVADTTSHVSVSDPLFLTIDTTPPPQPKIEGISNNAIIKNQNLQIKVSCPLNTIATVYLSNKIIAQNKQLHLLKIKKNDGTYTLKSTCTDIAQNKSEKIVSFSIDTTPPSKPTITFAHDVSNKTLTLKVYCKENGTVKFFKAGIATQDISCKKNTYAPFVEKGVNYPYYATYTANISDTSGNTSALTEKTVYITNTNVSSFKALKIVCTSILLLENKEFTNTYCTVPQEEFIKYQKTTLLSKDTYASALEVRGIQSAIMTTTVFGCKHKTFWNPKTWFSCVNEKSQEITTDVLVTPYITSSDALQNQDSKTIVNTHQKKEWFDIHYKFNFEFAVKVGDEMFSHQFTGDKMRQTIVPDYSNSNPKAYFSWIFSAPKQVNQWYGNTVYEKPHSGIDFAVTHENIVAPAEGKVVVSAYHKKSQCNAGGNYLGIKHPNGLYSYYFHIKSAAYTTGSYVKKGSKIATSGNSGMYNCEPLAAHLHFEVRTSMAGTSHVNPVPYFTIDWNTITTAKIDRFPGRLSGNNPHPKF
ncbi:M23 family metallopeptidase [bacterium]|nr:M23 family metallopeptidase [bacterium]